MSKLLTICLLLWLSIIHSFAQKADDIIGTLALKGAKAGYHVVIVSGDKDMMQLVNENLQGRGYCYRLLPAIGYCPVV